MKRTDVINYLIKEKGLTSYLEIGASGENFNKVKAPKKVGVDPHDTSLVAKKSDQFFKDNKDKFDLIFIDGVNSYSQSMKDAENALRALTDKGFLVLHNVLPKNVEYTKHEWCGEMWRTGIALANSLKVKTWNNDHGVLVCGYIGASNKIDPNMDYPGLEKLKEYLNAVDSFDELIPNEKIVTVSPSEIEIEENPIIDQKIVFRFDNLSDDELADLYKKEFGKKPHHKKKRETIIQDLNEALSSDSDNS